MGVYLVLKDLYYGDILSNSFYYKSDVANRVTENLREFNNFVIFYLSIPIILIVYGAIRRTFNVWFLIPMAGVLLVINFYLNSRLDTNYAYRFFFHVYPVILFIALVSVKSINKYFLAGLIVIQIVLYGFALDKELTFVNKQKEVNQAALQMSEYINTNYSKNSKLAIYLDAGAIPFTTKLQALDVAGLMSKDICEKEYQIRKRYKYIDMMHKEKNEPLEAPQLIFDMRSDELFRFDPDLIVVNSRDSIPAKFEDTKIGILKTPEYDKFFRDQYLGVLQLDIRFLLRYKFVKGFGSNGYFYMLFDRVKNGF